MLFLKDDSSIIEVPCGRCRLPARPVSYPANCIFRVVCLLGSGFHVAQDWGKWKYMDGDTCLLHLAFVPQLIVGVRMQFLGKRLTNWARWDLIIWALGDPSDWIPALTLKDDAVWFSVVGRSGATVDDLKAESYHVYRLLNLKLVTRRFRFTVLATAFITSLRPRPEPLGR